MGEPHEKAIKSQHRLGESRLLPGVGTAVLTESLQKVDALAEFVPMPAP